MSDYRTLSAKEAAEILKSAEHPTVIMHVRPDGDTVGSASALVLILKALGKDANMICSDPIPERLKFLTEGIPMAEDISGRELISIDVASQTQLGIFADKTIRLMIDHHAKGTRFADSYIIPDSSSAAEVLFEIARVLIDSGELTVSQDIAKRIYAAISSDTGGFLYSNASASSHRLAAALIETGIDHADINHRLFNSKSEQQIKAEGYIASHLSTAHEGKIAYATLSLAERQNLGIGSEHFDTAIDVIRAVRGAEVAVFIRELDDGTFRASLRSVGADVASVAECFGGGGHIRAAGCSPKASNIESAKEMLINKISENI